MATQSTKVKHGLISAISRRIALDCWLFPGTLKSMVAHVIIEINLDESQTIINISLYFLIKFLTFHNVEAQEI